MATVPVNLSRYLYFFIASSRICLLTDCRTRCYQSSVHLLWMYIHLLNIVFWLIVLLLYYF